MAFTCLYFTGRDCHSTCPSRSLPPRETTYQCKCYWCVLPRRFIDPPYVLVLLFSTPSWSACSAACCPVLTPLHFPRSQALPATRRYCCLSTNSLPGSVGIFHLQHLLARRPSFQCSCPQVGEVLSVKESFPNPLYSSVPPLIHITQAHTLSPVEQRSLLLAQGTVYTYLRPAGTYLLLHLLATQNRCSIRTFQTC